MRFISLYMIKAAFTFTYLLRTCLADECVNGPFGDTGVFIGNPKVGPNFCASQWERGLAIVGIEVWSGKYQLKGIRFTYSDESKTPIYGTKAEDDNPQLLRWDAQTKVESLKMWPNGDFNSVGRIFLTLVGGKNIDVNHNSKTFSGHQPNIDVGTGTLIGAYGNADQEHGLAMMKLLFLGDAASKVEILDMNFGNTIQDWNEKKKGIQSVMITSTVYKNSMPIGGSDMDWKFTNTKEKETKMETSHASTQTWGLGYSLAVGVSVGVPVLGSVSATSTYSMTYGSSEMFTKTEGVTIKDTLAWEGSGTLKPHSAVLCEASAFQGIFDAEYTATIRLTTKNKKQYTYTDPGRFKSTGWQATDADCKEIPWTDALRLEQDGRIPVSEASLPSTTLQLQPTKPATGTKASKSTSKPSKTLSPKKQNPNRRPQSKNAAAPAAKATSAPVDPSNQKRGLDFTA